MQELIRLMQDMVSLLDAANVFEKVKAEGEKGEPQQITTTSTEKVTAEVQGEQSKVQELSKPEEAPPVTEQPPSITKQVLLVSTALVIYASKDKASEEKILEEEPPTKRLKFLISNPSTTLPMPLRSIFPQDMTVDQFIDTLFNITSSEFSPTHPRYESKGKGITTEENQMKDLIPLIEEGGSDLQLHSWNTYVT
ncbi:hypothetical protein Tco_1399414 [Tanacetum coccineum]